MPQGEGTKLMNALFAFPEFMDDAEFVGGDDDEDEEGGWAGYGRDTSGPKIAPPLGRAASVDYQVGGRYGHIRTPSRTNTAPARQLREYL